ncbi:MAG TPA: SDR family NAD(P)-dependent oxidoreductase [Thermomonospora sp.]|nr:SDR family NAD(P)-dependent oxidoreductase [Thermomonospora sp.]
MTTTTTIALVTGATRGIGHEIAAGLARLGMTVLLGARDADRGRAAAKALDGDVHPVTLDVTDPVSVDAAAASVEERFGRLDVLVNNAGISGGAAALVPGAADADAVREVFETNVFGVMRVTDAMLPLLRRSAAGHVVNLSSSVGSLTLMSDFDGPFGQVPASAAYAPSKTALNALTVQYAKELRATGIRVNAADPGRCDTGLIRDLGFSTARTAADGARVALRLATLGPEGPTGRIFDENGPVPW